MANGWTLFIQIAIFPGVLFILFGVLYSMYLERKIMARIHRRIGPLYVGFAGLLQTIADLMKLLFKEWIFPKKSKKQVLILAPVALFLLSYLLLSVIPWGPHWVVAKFEVSGLFAFATVSAFPFISLLIGWSSSSKYSLIGGIRSASQQISFEIPLFLSAASAFILANTLNLYDVAQAQAGHLWYFIINPLSGIIFFISILAMAERQPFDSPEAESEIVFGWKTDLSGMLFGWSIFASYTMTIAGSALFVTLFLGGFAGPSFLPGLVWFLVKFILVILIFFIIRATISRFRMDQILKLSWAYLVPLAILSNILTAILLYVGVV